MSAAMPPTDVDVIIQRGNALEDQGHAEAALSVYRSALHAAPGSQRALLNIGNALLLLHRVDEAESSFVAANQMGAFAPALLNLGNLCASRADWSGAMQRYRGALELRPGWDQAHLGLCNALFQARQPEAEAQLRALLALHPRLAKARLMLAEILALTQSHEALALLHSLAGNAEAHERAAKIHLNHLNQPAAVQEFQRALELDPANDRIASAYAFYSLYCEEQAAAEFRQVMDFHVGRRYGNATQSLPRRSATRIRVGYISGDFVAHALMHYAFTLFEHHDRSRFEVYAISGASNPDHITQQLRDRVDGWLDIAGLSDAAACALIREHQIDILIDLSGRSSANRLGVMALRAAPLQMTAMGVLSSTLTPNVDMRIADVHTDPVGQTEAWHSESLLRMRNFHACYTQLRDFPAQPDLPALDNGYLTFGYFNNALKITRPALRDWAQVMSKIPSSRLLVLGVQNALIGHSIEDCLIREHGIDAKRIQIRARLNLPEVTAAMSSIDIAFDPYPYSGGITSIESLLAGVPFVSIAGNRSSSRNGLAILRNVGMHDWIASSHADFIDVVCVHAQDLSSLQSLRQSLPERCRASALMNPEAFIGEWEALLLQSWQSIPAR